MPLAASRAFSSRLPRMEPERSITMARFSGAGVAATPESSACTLTNRNVSPSWSATSSSFPKRPSTMRVLPARKLAPTGSVSPGSGGVHATVSGSLVGAGGVSDHTVRLDNIIPTKDKNPTVRTFIASPFRGTTAPGRVPLHSG